MYKIRPSTRPVVDTSAIIFLLSVLLVACSIKVPGGYTYGIKVSSVAGTLMDGEGGQFKYGRYERKFGRGGGGGDRGISGYREFLELDIRWVASDGTKRFEVIDIAPLIQEMKSKHRIRRLYKPHSIKVHARINGANLTLTYDIISSTGPKVKTDSYDLYQSSKNKQE